jgi:uncharacterized membrane protein SpoIIM required for sporulation
MIFPLSYAALVGWSVQLVAAKFSFSHFSLAVAVTALTAFLLAAASAIRSALAVVVAVAGPREIAFACFCGAMARAP